MKPTTKKLLTNYHRQRKWCERIAEAKGLDVEFVRSLMFKYTWSGRRMRQHAEFWTNPPSKFGVTNNRRLVLHAIETGIE